MPKPTPGKYYTVVQGDRIRDISRRAYGFDDSDRITDSNSALLKGRIISLEGLPTIFPGDKLWLVEETTKDEQKIEYEKPLFEEHQKKFFAEEIWEKFTPEIKSCMQCSGCHGCR